MHLALAETKIKQFLKDLSKSTGLEYSKAFIQGIYEVQSHYKVSEAFQANEEIVVHYNSNTFQKQDSSISSSSNEISEKPKKKKESV